MFEISSHPSPLPLGPRGSQKTTKNARRNCAAQSAAQSWPPAVLAQRILAGRHLGLRSSIGSVDRPLTRYHRRDSTMIQVNISTHGVTDRTLGPHDAHLSARPPTTRQSIRPPSAKGAKLAKAATDEGRSRRLPRIKRTMQRLAPAVRSLTSEGMVPVQGRLRSRRNRPRSSRSAGTWATPPPCSPATAALSRRSASPAPLSTRFATRSTSSTPRWSRAWPSPRWSPGATSWPSRRPARAKRSVWGWFAAASATCADRTNVGRRRSLQRSCCRSYTG